MMTREELRATWERRSRRCRGCWSGALRGCASLPAQRERDEMSNLIEGGTAGQQVVAVTSAGCYAPGGRYRCPRR